MNSRETQLTYLRKKTMPEVLKKVLAITANMFAVPAVPTARPHVHSNAIKFGEIVVDTTTYDAREAKLAETLQGWSA